MAKKFLDQLTKKYSLSKTLRFELKPVGKTLDFLKQNKVFEKDIIVDTSYNQAKFYFDEFYRNFIKEALSPDNVYSLKKDLESFAKTFEDNSEKIKNTHSRKNTQRNGRKKEIKEAQEEIGEQRKKMYELIASLFVRADKGIRSKYLNKKEKDKEQKEVKFILSKDIIPVLKKEFPKEKNGEFLKKGWPSLFVDDEINPGKKIYIFDSFEKFTTYLSHFQQARKNIYKGNGTQTAIATRIVENFERFLQNKIVFDKKYKNYINQIKNFFEKNREEEGLHGNLHNLVEIFDLNYYLSCFLQEGINVYNKKIGELNRIVKMFRDKEKVDKSQLPLFRTLNKQILGKVEKEEDLIKPIDSKSEEEVFLEKFSEFIQKNEEKFSLFKELMKKLKNNEFENEYQGIYLNKGAINTISRRWLVDSYQFIENLPHTKSKERGIKVKKFVSLSDVKEAIEKIGKNSTQLFKDRYYKEILEENLNKKENSRNQTEEERYFAILSLRDENYWQQFLNVWYVEFKALFKLDRKFGKKGKDDLISYEKSLGDARNLQSFSKESKKDRAIVKNYSDSALRIFQMSKYFLLSDKNQKETPLVLSQEFYSYYDQYYQDFDFIKYYNAFRNYITKKPYNTDKIKLNFETGSFLKGWNISKESDYLGMIFLKDRKYYLGIVKKDEAKSFDFYDNKKDNKKEKERKVILREEAFAKETDDYYLKMNYDQVADASKDTLNLVLMPDGSVQRFTKKEKKNEFWPKYIREIKNRKSYTMGKNFNRDDLIRFIDYFKKCAEIYWSRFNLKLKEPAEYKNFKEFTNDINSQAYKISFEKIKKQFIDKNISLGNLYFFQIYNKDFSRYNKGKKNIHTLYFEEIFSERNASDSFLVRLNGKAEVFLRPKSKMKKIIPDRLKGKKRNNQQVYELNRYLENKILFHCPITLNAVYNDISKQEQMNSFVNLLIKRSKEVNEYNEINVIGIDRGEKNLLYYTVINQKEEILDFGSLNEIGGKNYFVKLIQREVERQKNRQSWQPVIKIKDLKSGYLSYVINKLTELIEKYNAIVVLEGLNFRFKQIRGGIERTVYQQFEKALINKLGYLAFKDNRNPEDPGGVLNGYQLVAPFKSFQLMGKQTGVLFYTNAEYTSKTDPLTGFRKNIYINNSASQEKIKDFIKKCKEIGWDEKEKSYYFVYNPSNYDKNNASYDWKVFSKVSRIRREKNSNGYWEPIQIDLNQKFEDLFELWKFKNKKARDLKSAILEKDKNGELRGKREFDGKERNFFQSFIYLFNLILQTRNTLSLQIIKNEEGEVVGVDGGVDFFASPVKPFFRTLALRKKYNEKGEIIKEEIFKDVKKNFADFEAKFKDKSNLDNFDSDGIGAYNIARKGLMILKEIEKNSEKPDLFIKKTDWDNFVLKKQ